MTGTEFSVAAMRYRIRFVEPPETETKSCDELGTEAKVAQQLRHDILNSVAAAECPSGWPKHDPATYATQLAVKAALVREAFPEATCGVEVFESPPSNHRMRAKIGLVGTENGEESARSLGFSNSTEGRIDALEIASHGICAAMPLLLEALKAEPTLRVGAKMVTILSKRKGTLRRRSSTDSLLPSEAVACLVYDRPIDEQQWRAAATRVQTRWADLNNPPPQAAAAAAACGADEGAFASIGTGAVRDEIEFDDDEGGSDRVKMSLIGQAKGHRVVVGPMGDGGNGDDGGSGECSQRDYVREVYELKDGRTLRYKHVMGHFSNPNAFACKHTLDWLSDVATNNIKNRASVDLLELYCGNGNHTVALAPLFRAALAVEINPTLCVAAEENLAANGVTNASIQLSPSHDFCTRVLRKRSWTHKPTGREFEFGAVLVDPPRAGLDDHTRALVAKYTHVLYISCNPFVSLRRDLDALLAPPHNFSIERLALIDHFPYTPHTECAVYLHRPA
mmetsp:Transcript_78428/g.153448  ORF Transcript_78428/g.153448 Transcript_78428/m.153448 type:complete len:507 (+) Transcript_78428:122-1642(+)